MPGDVKWRSADEIVLNALRNEVTGLLAECTEPQRAFFHKIYPQGVGSMSEEKLRNAVGICQRTVAKNRRTAKEPNHG